MNKTTKPISSPGRTEKFPPPLMRFLRSNVGNKSRRRSRARPMFVRKKNTLFETTQEPSSPKVTCIGQVRVRRSKKNHKTTAATTTNHHRNRRNNRLCRCLRNIKPASCISVWSKWVSFFQCWRCKNYREKSQQHPQQQQQEEQEQEQECKHVARTEVDNINEGLISQSSPKNKLLLTRCRSAPYRSSSLANMFRESMKEKSEEEEEEEEVAEKMKNIYIEKEDGGVNEEGTCNESDGCEESKQVPLILSRCKSEPARRWDQLLPI